MVCLSVFHRVNATYSPLTDYICSEVKGGPSMRIYLCKRLPNYQSWFSTSLNFLIGLPFWLPLITRFHIPLMNGGVLMCTCSLTLALYIQKYAQARWHLRTNKHVHTSHFLPLITVWDFVCVTVKPTPCNVSFSAKRHIKPFSKKQEASLNNLWSAYFFIHVVFPFCSIPTHQKNRRNSWRKTRASPSYKWTTGKSFQSLHAVDFWGWTPRAIPVLNDWN